MANMIKYRIPLFYPSVNEEMRKAAYAALGKKIIAQGQKVKEFEKLLNLKLGTHNLLTVNSCTSALELAYHLLNLQPGDEVIAPVFTCTATNLPLIRRGVKIIFADVKENMSPDWDDILKKITPKTKAIVNVHLFGLLNKGRKLAIPIVGDAAQYLEKTTGERFTTYSFQAVKIMTTVDGGALVCEQERDFKRAKLLRWYGIDRESGRDNIDVDITEAGFKYHMNDVAAAIGIAGLKILNKLKKERTVLQNLYIEKLKDVSGIKVIGGSPFLIHVPNREKLMLKLASLGIETGLGHRRNDLYTVFGGKRQNLPNMNRLEKTYLLLPCHNKMSVKDVDFICESIRKVHEI